MGRLTELADQNRGTAKQAAAALGRAPDGRVKGSRVAALLAALQDAPAAREIRTNAFAPDDIEALRAYVAEEARIHGGPSDTVLFMFHELGSGDAARDAAMDIFDAMPRLDKGPLI